MAAASSSGDELRGMYERKLRALSLENALRRVLDPKLDTTWEKLVEVYLAHRDSVASDMIALISSFDADDAVAAARSVDEAQAAGTGLPPLAAAPFVISDNLESSAAVTSAGLAFLDEWEAGVDAPIVTAAMQAGGLLVGKSNLAELGMSATGANPAFGTPRNPYDKTRSAGGSCGGVAAAVAARFAVFGIGVDGPAGGLRVPAALCGCVAYRPSMARYPRSGFLSTAPSRDVASLACRSVADVIMIDAALRGASTEPMHESLPSPTSLAGVKFARLGGGFWEGLGEGVEDELAAACAALEKAGAEVVDVDVDPSALPGIGGAALPADGCAVGSSALETCEAVGAAVDGREAVVALAQYFWERGARTSVLDLVEAIQGEAAKAKLFCQLRGDRAGYVSVKEASDAVTYGKAALKASLEAALVEQGCVAYLLPACAVTAPTVEEAEAGDEDGAALASLMARSSAVAANAEMCSVVVPCGATGSGSSRLPVALEVVAPAGSDDALLTLALAIEAAVPKTPAPRGL